MPHKHRHSRPHPAKPKPAPAPSPPPRRPKFSIPPVIIPLIGAGVIAAGLALIGAGLRFVYSQHYAARAQRALRIENNLPEVESNALKAVQLFHSNGFAHHMLGSFYRIQGRHDEARARLQRALRTTNHPGASYHGLGEVALLGGRIPPAQGVSDFERGLRMWPRPSPEPAYVWYEAGALAVNNGMPARAILFMTRSEGLLAEAERDISLAKAEAFEALGSPRTAALYLLRQLLLDPNFSGASNYLLAMCRRTGQFADGRFVLESAITARADTATLRTAAAALEFMAGRLVESAAHARGALEINPRLASPHYFLGEIAWKQEDWAGAKQHYEEYVQRSAPDDPQIAAVRNRLEELDRRLAP